MKIKYSSALNLLVVFCMVMAVLPVTGVSAQASQPDPKTSGFNLLDGAKEIFAKVDPEIRDLLLTKADGEIKVSVLVVPGTNISSLMGKHVVVKTTTEFDRVVGFIPVQNVIKVAALKGTLVLLNMDSRPAPEVLRPTGDEGDFAEVEVPDIKSIDKAALQAIKAGKPDTGLIAPEGFSLAADKYRVKGTLASNDTKDYFTNDYNGVYQTWNNFGVTGDGNPDDPLKVAVIDSGVDFANNDLLGTAAHVTDPNSAYYDAGLGIGWPIAFDDRSMSDYLLDYRDGYNNYAWYMATDMTTGYVVDSPLKADIVDGVIVDPDMGSNAEFCFVVDVPLDIQDEYSPDGVTPWPAEQEFCVSSEVQDLPGNTGNYRFGWHPDYTLGYWYGQPIGVLVLGFDYGADWGPYNAVIVDMETDFGTDFTFGYLDPLARLGSEELGVWDGWSTDLGFNDHSGGLVYFIADGEHSIPASDWVYGLEAPEAGTIVSFMINNFDENGGDHGQLCAGTVIGQGQIYKVPYAGTYGSPYWPPTWYSPSWYGGINQGAARDSKLVAMGNYYMGGSSLNNYDFTALGYDGIPAGALGDTHDQPQINSNSYGSGAVENDGWDFGSRYMSLINRGYVAQQDIELPDGGAHSSLFVKSAGNSGFGYGTINTPGSETGVMAGASSVFGQFNFGDTAHSYSEVNWGNLTGMSDRGPSAMGNGGVSVLTNGMFGSGNIPVNMAYFYRYYFGAYTGTPAGDTAVDNWAGTSRSGPEAMGILALIYDAYYTRFGEYPSWEEARTLLMNGARTTYSDPFAQGAGLANAANSVEIIYGLDGAMVTNEDGDGFWNVGNFRGEEYPGYTMGLFPGESDTETFSLTNYSLVPKFFQAEAVTMELIDSRDWNFTTLPLNGTGAAGEGSGARYYERRLYGPSSATANNFGGTSPFYNSDNGYDASILYEADLMVVRMSYPWAEYQNYEPDNWWFLYVWAWHDTTTSAPYGQWYNDADGNTVRNSGEYGSYGANELVRVNYDYHGNVAEVRIREPYKLLTGTASIDNYPYSYEPYSNSMSDMIISLRHFQYSSAFNTTDMNVTVELYKEVPWDNTIQTQSGVVLPGTKDPNNLITILPMGTTNLDVTAYAEDYYGTSLLYEPFNNWMSINWNVDLLSGGSGNWITTQTMENPNAQTYASWAAEFNSHTAYPGDSAVLWYGAALDLSQFCSPEVNFWMYHDSGFPTKMDYAQIQVAVLDGVLKQVESGEKATFLWEDVGDPIYRYSASDGWTNHTVDLSAYAGHRIILGIKGVSDAGNNIYLDDVQLIGHQCKAPGAYTGYLKVYETNRFGDLTSNTIQYLPITMNVFFSGEDPAILGFNGFLFEAGLYNNGLVYGATGTSDQENGSQRAESGDWRFFFTDITETPKPGTFLLAQTLWPMDGDPESGAATDIDTLIYGPVPHDGFFSGAPYLNDLFGPSGLKVIGGSARVGTAPAWDYYTTTGGPTDWSAVEVKNEGLHAVAAQVTRWGGTSTTLPFTIALGTANVTPEVGMVACDQQPLPEAVVEFTTNHPGLKDNNLEAVTYGFTVPVDEYLGIAQGYWAWDTYEVVATDTYQLKFNTSLPVPGYDIDLQVWYSADGISGWTLVGDSAGSDSEEEVVLMNPVPGFYEADVYGYTVPAPVVFNLKIEEISGKGALLLSDLPTSINLNETYQIGVSIDPAFAPLDKDTYKGYIFLGPLHSPYMIKIPVTLQNSYCLMLPLISR